MDQGFSAAHWLGTDSLGRDLLSRISLAVSESVLPLIFVVILAFILGLGLFFMTCSRDSRLVRILKKALLVTGDFLVSVPITIALFLLLVGLESVNPIGIILIVIFFSCCIRTYSECSMHLLKDQHLAYWESHHCLGGRKADRVWSYGLIGKWLTPLAMHLSHWLRLGIIIEASLSYLGFGISEPQASLGNMLAMHFSQFLRGQSSTVIVISLSFVVVLASISQLCMRVTSKIPSRE
jgi:peptide/nickel transport system permease protein